MRVVKRNGEQVPVSFDKIIIRLNKLCNDPLTGPPLTEVDVTLVAQKTCASVHDLIKTSDIDSLSAQVAVAMGTLHPEYETLAARIAVSNLHKMTEASCLSTFSKLYETRNMYDEPCQLLGEETWRVLSESHALFDSWLNWSADYSYTYFGIKTMDAVYLTKVNGVIVERPQHLFLRVAVGIWGGELDMVKQTYELLSQKAYTHATPTLFNSGMAVPQLASCFLLGCEKEQESVEGIYDVIKRMALISKRAGGIGVHLHDIRSKGALIRGTNGKSSGLMPLLKVINTTARYIDQAGRRAGAIAVYLEPWHPDVFDFLEMRRAGGAEDDRARDLFQALWIPDLFFKRVEAKQKWSLFDPVRCPGLADVWGDEFETLYERYEKEEKWNRQVEAQDLWFHILTSLQETSMPYIFAKDACNRKSNQKNAGTIRSSNLCVAPNTLLLTKTGYRPISDLWGQEVEVWNGVEFSRTEVMKTGQDQTMVKVTFSNYADVTCTPYHKFAVTDGARQQKQKLVEARDLRKGMKLIKCNFPVIDGTEELRYPYTHGFFCGDGTYTVPAKEQRACQYKAGEDSPFCKRHMYLDKCYLAETKSSNGMCAADSWIKMPMVALYDEKKDLLPYLDCRSCTGLEDKAGRLNCQLPADMTPKYYVPLQAPLTTKLLWLAGLADADGTRTDFNGNEGLQISSINLYFLKQVRLLLQTVGADARISLVHTDRKSLLPDGRGGKRLFDSQACYRILVCNDDLRRMIDLGFKPHRLMFNGDYTPQRSARRFIMVEEVLPAPNTDTFCFNEPKRHLGIFNGIIAGNCAEIVQYSSPDEVSVCNLSSISLPHFIRDGSFDLQRLMEVTKVVTRNLNKVIDATWYPLPEARRSNLRHRPMGIGVQGLADVFSVLRMPFESAEARALNRGIFETVYFGAVSASVELAKEQGPYETFGGSPMSRGEFQFDMWGVKPSDRWDWEGLRQQVQTHGIRNSLLIAPMPTASTSQILGNTEAIEPYSSNLFTRKTLAGTFVIVNRHLVQDLSELGLWSKQMKDQIVADGGSVQDIDGIPPDIKALYKTSWEMSQKALIDMAIDRGAFICQSQSLNLFVKDPSFAKLSSMLFYSWKKGAKTLSYYLRSKPATEALKFTVAPKPQAPAKSSLESCEMCSS